MPPFFNCSWLCLCLTENQLRLLCFKKNPCKSGSLCSLPTFNLILKHNHQRLQKKYFLSKLQLTHCYRQPLLQKKKKKNDFFSQWMWTVQYYFSKILLRFSTRKGGLEPYTILEDVQSCIPCGGAPMSSASRR